MRESTDSCYDKKVQRVQYKGGRILKPFNKYLISCLAVLGIIASPSVSYGATASSKTITDLLKKRETISRDIERNRKEAETKRKEAAKISSDIKKIDGDIAVTESRIKKTEESIVDTEKQIAETTAEIVRKENELAKENSHQQEAIRTIYETTGQNSDLLIFSDSVSQIIDRASYLEALEVRIEATIDDITKLHDELVEDKKSLEEKQKELESLKKQQEAYRKGLDYQKSKKQQLLVDAKEAIAEYEKRLDEARKAYQDVNSELFKLTAAARKKAANRGSKKVGNITFAYPLSGELTTNFGEPTPIQSFHTGFDIDGIIGDPIVAAANGTVTFAGGNSRYGYGLYITIDHGDGVSSLYGHMSGFEVSQGDEVKLGQKIGYVGNTGFAIAFAGGDASHLHFEIREDGIPVNPGIYLP